MGRADGLAERPEIWIVRAGKLSYGDGLTLQESVARARRDGEVPDVALFLEHWPVYTKGRRSEPGHLPMGEEWYRMQGIEVAETDRGGQVTYHGPGQLVAYPIVDLKAWAAGPTGHGRVVEKPGPDVVGYVRALEQAMIAALGAFEIPAQVFEGLTGVWTAGEPPISPGEIGPQRTPVGAGGLSGGEARKIGSIGIHVSGGITTHGFAVNVSNDLQPFEWIVPCAIDHVRMTSVGRELERELPVDEFAGALRDHLAEALGRRSVERTLAELGAVAVESR
jgi:lipoyl(octanoyl) transferase